MQAISSTLGAIFRAGRSLVVGMGVTMRELLSPPVTVQYPDRRPEVSPLFRGHPVLLSDEQGRLKCTACMACARACPVEAISIESARGEDRKMYPKAWYLNMGRCLECNMCVEACRFEALGMSPRFELAVDSPEGLVYDLETLAELGRTGPYSRVMVGDRLEPPAPEPSEPERSGLEHLGPGRPGSERPGSEPSGAGGGER